MYVLVNPINALGTELNVEVKEQFAKDKADFGVGKTTHSSML
jgi:hypothetical protein